MAQSSTSLVIGELSDGTRGIIVEQNAHYYTLKVRTRAGISENIVVEPEDVEIIGTINIAYRRQDI